MMNSDEQTPLQRLSSTFLYIWRLAIPFWMFRDAGCGTLEQRIANYRYNRARRKVLPFYLWKWIGIAVCMLQLTQMLSRQMADGAGASICAAFFCMSAGIGFAFSCVVIAVLGVTYLYLSYVKR